MNRGPQPSPWTLVVLTGGALALVALFGVDGACSVVASALALVFLVFLIRHLAFAVSALWNAPFDVRTQTGFDFGFRPFVTVLVPCRNEELVIWGLVSCLLAIDFPHDLIELVVIDDGSDDRTGEILDGL